MELSVLANAINRQTADLARDTARQIKNVWICEDGTVKTIEDPIMLRARVMDDEKKLSDLLRMLDKEMESGSKVSSAVSCAAEGRNGSHGDASETE